MTFLNDGKRGDCCYNDKEDNGYKCRFLFIFFYVLHNTHAVEFCGIADALI